MGEAIVAVLAAVGFFVVVPLWRWRARVYRNACVALCDAIYGIATPYGRVQTIAIAYGFAFRTALVPVMEGLTKWLIEVRNGLEPVMASFAEMVRKLDI